MNLLTAQIKFASLPPHAQYKQIQSSEEDVAGLYTQAKDDLIRLTIVQKSGSSELAQRLYHNTRYAKIKVALQSLFKIETPVKFAGGTVINMSKLSSITKKLIAPTDPLTNEEMKAWVENVGNLNKNNETVKSLTKLIITFMSEPEAENTVAHYFDIFLDVLSDNITKGTKIQVPEPIKEETK